MIPSVACDGVQQETQSVKGLGILLHDLFEGFYASIDKVVELIMDGGSKQVTPPLFDMGMP